MIGRGRRRIPKRVAIEFRSQQLEQASIGYFLVSFHFREYDTSSRFVRSNAVIAGDRYTDERGLKSPENWKVDAGCSEEGVAGYEALHAIQVP